MAEKDYRITAYIHGINEDTGEPVANSGDWPQVYASFGIKFTRQDQSPTVTWDTHDFSWHADNGYFWYMIHAAIAINPADPNNPDWNTELWTILEKSYHTESNNWWGSVYTAAPGPYDTTCTSDKIKLYVYVKAEHDCCNGSWGNFCYPNYGREWYMIDSFEFDIPAYETFYTVSYNTAGGTPSTLADQTKSSISALILYSAPTYPLSIIYHNNPNDTRNVNRPFNGWYSSSDSTTYPASGSYNTNADSTMTAQWGDASFTPIALPNSNVTINYYFSSTPTSVSSGRTKLGYDTSSSSSAYPYVPGNTYYTGVDLNLYPKYGNATFVTPNLPDNSVRVTFNPMGGTISQSYRDIARSKLGYSTSSSATTAQYSQGATINTSSNMNLYPVYGDATLQKSTIPDPTRSGYLFQGWYYDSACTNPVGATITTKTNIIIYAKWLALPVHKVQNNGTWSDDGPYVWQCVMENGTKVWRKVAKLYKFDGTNWQNISE